MNRLAIVLTMSLALLLSAGCQGQEIIEENSDVPSVAPTLLDPGSVVSEQPENQEPSGRVLIVFGDQYEYWHYIEITESFEQKGYSIETASYTLETLTGKDFDNPENRPTMQADMLLTEVSTADYQAVILINDWAGYLTGEFPEINSFIHQVIEEDKIIAAYDYAPMILGEAGVLEGVKVTAHISAHSVCESLERSYGALCTSALIEHDGNIITADGFNSPASWFGSYVVDVIRGLSESP